MENEERLLLDRKRSANLLSISLRTLDALLARRELAPTRVGRRVLIHRRDLEKFAARSHSQAQRI